MTAILIQHWQLLTTAWNDPRLSLTKATRLIRDELSQLIPIVTQLLELIELLRRWRTQLPRPASRYSTNENANPTPPNSSQTQHCST